MALVFHNGEKELTKKIEKKFPNEKHKLFIVGGDGTFLRALSAFEYNEIPLIFAFKNGTVSFLLPFKISEAETVLKNSDENKYKKVERARLLLESHSKLFVNELVLRSRDFKLNSFQISINGSKFSIRGSEIIISTRTGSSGYNLSLDGPLVFAESIIINCSAPNRCNFKTLVLPIDSIIEIISSGCEGYIDRNIVSGDFFRIVKGDSYQIAIPDEYSEYDIIDQIFSSPCIRYK